MKGRIIGSKTALDGEIENRLDTLKKAVGRARCRPLGVHHGVDVLALYVPDRFFAMIRPEFFQYPLIVFLCAGSQLREIHTGIILDEEVGY